MKCTDSLCSICRHPIGGARIRGRLHPANPQFSCADHPWVITLTPPEIYAAVAHFGGPLPLRRWIMSMISQLDSVLVRASGRACPCGAPPTAFEARIRDKMSYYFGRYLALQEACRHPESPVASPVQLS